MLTGNQLVAARGLLGWKQAQLSDAIAARGGKLSVTAITAFERGGSIRESNRQMIESTLEAEGIQFLEAGTTADGVGVALKR